MVSSIRHDAGLFNAYFRSNRQRDIMSLTKKYKEKNQMIAKGEKRHD